MQVTQVAHVYHPSFGGIENYAHRLHRSLEADGHTSRVVTTDASLSPGSPVEPESHADYCTTDFSLFRNPFSLELYRRLRRDDADVYHLHSPWFLPTLEAVAALPDDAAVTMTVHGFDTGRSLTQRALNVAYWPFAQYIFSQVDRVFVLGESEGHRVTGRFRTRDDQVTVVPNGIDPEAYDVPEGAVDGFRETYGIDPDVPTVLYVSRLVPVKRPDLLVDAVTNHLADEDVQVLVVGRGDPEYVGSLVQRAGPQVRFLSNLPFEDLKAAYHAADLFVALGVSEGFPTVLLEAMNGGLPVVTTPAGAVPDVVRDPENGRVLDRKPTAAEVAGAIREYLDDPELCRTTGERNRALVREAYTWDGVYERIRDTYEELLAER